MSYPFSSQMPPLRTDDLKCPAQGNEAAMQKWFRERLADGEFFKNNQPGYPSVDAARRILRNQFNSRTEAGINNSLSDVQFNRSKRQFKEVVFTMSNAEPEMGFDIPPDNPDDPSESAQEKHFTEMLNKRLQEFLARPESRQRIRDWLYLAGIAIAYLSPVMGDPLSPDVRDDDVKWVVYDVDDVMFWGMGRDRDPQAAEGCIIRNRIPLQRMRDKYPGYRFNADYTDPWYLRGFVGKLIRSVAPSAWDIGNKRDTQEPSVVLYHVYVNDRSINETGQTLKMGYDTVRLPDGTTGLRETAWSYDVPSLGAPIPSGTFKTDDYGNIIPVMRPATKIEARIYPNRRLIMRTETIPLYDGPSYWAHGLVPIVPFRFEDQPMEFISGSFFSDAESLQRLLDDILRGLADTTKRRQRPGFFYDSQQVTDADAAEMGKFLPAAMLSFDSFGGVEPIKPLLPPEYSEIDQKIFEVLTLITSAMDYMLGTNDIQGMQDVKQIPAADTIETILRAAGPLTTDRARRMELAMRDLGYMTGMLFGQFDSLKRRLRLAGPLGINAADFDYDPSNMIPSHLPGEDKGKPSIYSRLQRTQFYMGRRAFYVIADSAYGTSNVQAQLQLELLRERGFPISDETVARVMRIKDYSGEVKKWSQEQINKARVMGLSQATLQQIVQLGQLATQLGSVMGGPQGGVGESNGATGNPEGRKPSFQEPPEQQTKGDGRQVISTSG